MNPHDRFYRGCGHLTPWRRWLKRGTEWLLICLACIALVGMYGYCQQADDRAAIVAQSNQ